MTDITQVAGSDIILFSADSEEAKAWMTKIYGRFRIYFHIPIDHALVQLFLRAAKARGFTISQK
jgi:hypothetical protein